MKIETKFNVGDNVYFMVNDKIANRPISVINIIVRSSVSTLYTIYLENNPSPKVFSESQLFASKAELLETL